jgi:hypothetical protein
MSGRYNDLAMRAEDQWCHRPPIFAHLRPSNKCAPPPPRRPPGIERGARASAPPHKNPSAAILLPMPSMDGSTCRGIGRDRCHRGLHGRGRGAESPPPERSSSLDCFHLEFFKFVVLIKQDPFGSKRLFGVVHAISRRLGAGRCALAGSQLRLLPVACCC